MRKLVIPLAVAVTALVSASTIAFASGTASAQQHPVGGSGIHGDIHFMDDGSTLTVDGTATGLQGGTLYFSLIYGLGTTPGGIAEGKSVPGVATPPCNDVNKNGTSNITEPQMILGFWTPLGSPNATLHVVKSHSGNSQEPLFESLGHPVPGDSYAPIGSFQTVSIRNVNNQFALVACGEVH